MFAGTVVLCGIISVGVAPIWQSRYLYNSWGMFCLAIALVIGEKKNRLSLFPQGLTIVLLIITGVISIHSFLSGELNVNTSNEFVAYINNNISVEDCIIVDDPAEHHVLYEYYIPESKIIMSDELDIMLGDVDINVIMEDYEEQRRDKCNKIDELAKEIEKYMIMDKYNVIARCKDGDVIIGKDGVNDVTLDVAKEIADAHKNMGVMLSIVKL